MNRIAVLVVLLLLTGCMLVEDFGAAWTQAKPDPCLSKIAESLYYSEFRRDPSGKKMDHLARALDHGYAHYLLLKQEASDKGGRMYRFDVVNGIFARYRLVPTMRKIFEENYPGAPVDLSRDTVTFAALGDKEWELIDTIATQEEYWEPEEKALYNVLRDPACRYDDRPPEAASRLDKKPAPARMRQAKD